MTDETRKKLQKEIFDIFLEVKRVCEELDIPYFIMGGTALGAVRHGGFIPWDDDFDIGMAREHYETFISHAAQKLRPAIFFSHSRQRSVRRFILQKSEKIIPNL